MSPGATHNPGRGQHRPPMAPAPRVTPRPNVVEGHGHYFGTETIPPHTCKPPIAHVGCCDGSGRYVATGEEDREPSHFIPLPAGTVTLCMSGVPTGGPYWVCDDCGTGWRIADACDTCRWYLDHGKRTRSHAGACSTGTKWVEMTRREMRRVKRRAPRR